MQWTLNVAGLESSEEDASEPSVRAKLSNLWLRDSLLASFLDYSKPTTLTVPLAPFCVEE